MKNILEVKNICKTYQAKNGEIEALKDIITTTKNAEITVNRIKEKVASVCNIKMEDFNSKKRTRTIA